MSLCKNKSAPEESYSRGRASTRTPEQRRHTFVSVRDCTVGPKRVLPPAEQMVNEVLKNKQSIEGEERRRDSGVRLLRSR